MDSIVYGSSRDCKLFFRKFWGTIPLGNCAFSGGANLQSGGNSRNWTACSHRIGHAELRCLETVPALGPAPRRTALRENRRLVSVEMSYSNDEGQRAAIDYLMSICSHEQKHANRFVCWRHLQTLWAPRIFESQKIFGGSAAWTNKDAQ
jgi:hypothetical protein